MDDISAPRKLAPSEVERLRSLLKSKLNLGGVGQQSFEEDASDLLDYTFAMIANGKNITYVVEELKSMEMDVCDNKSADMLGRTLAKFLGDLDGGKSSSGGKKSSVGVGGNALTNSGALGSTATAKGGGRGGNNNNQRQCGRGGNFDNSRGGRGGMGGRGNGPNNNSNRQRSLHGAAFDRLNRSRPQDHNRSGRGGGQSQGRLGGRMDNRNNRAGRFGGRGDIRSSRMNNNYSNNNDNNNKNRGKDNFRDQPQEHHHHQKHDNKRKGTFEEKDFVSTAMEHGLGSSRDIAQQQQQSKQPRYDDATRFGRGRGGRGRGLGRFSYSYQQHEGDNKTIDTGTEEAAKVSESPLVQQSFRGRTGRGFRGGGRGRGGRGRRAGRDEIATAVKAKTWVRSRTIEEGLATDR